MKNRVDPELVPALEGFLSLLGGGLNLHDIPATRALLEQMRIATTAQLPPFEGVTSEDRRIPGPAGAPEVTVRIYTPTQKAANLPVMLWMHGGGLVLGDLESGDLALRQAVKAVNCVIVSVEYRLAPEHPFPAPLEDCYAALQWLVSHATELGVDPKRIAVGGASAGGGLAAGLALLARDRAEVNLAFQFLILAALDDRNVVQASETVADSLGWTRENSLIAWRSYLGAEPGGKDVAPYASPARAIDLTGLPPTYVCVGELDLFVFENIEYARRLIGAGVPTELHIYPGAYHGFDFIAPNSAVTQRFMLDCHNALIRAFCV